MTRQTEIPELPEEFTSEWLSNAARHAPECLSSLLSPFITWLADHDAELRRTLTNETPTTLVHCDLRLNNICFDGERCAFLDWQRSLLLHLTAVMPSPAINIDTGRGQEMMSRWRDRLNARLQRVDVSTLL